MSTKKKMFIPAMVFLSLSGAVTSGLWATPGEEQPRRVAEGALPYLLKQLNKQEQPLPGGEGEGKKLEPEKAELKTDFSWFETAYGLKLTRFSLTKNETGMHQMRFTLQFEKNLQPGELKMFLEALVTPGPPSKPKISFCFFDSENVSTGKVFFYPKDTSAIEGEITGSQRPRIRPASS